MSLRFQVSLPRAMWCGSGGVSEALDNLKGIQGALNGLGSDFAPLGYKTFSVILLSWFWTMLHHENFPNPGCASSSPSPVTFEFSELSSTLEVTELCQELLVLKAGSRITT